MKNNLLFPVLLFFLIQSFSYGQYRIEEWEKKPDQKDSVLLSIEYYDAQNRKISKEKPGSTNEEPLTIHYEYSTLGLENEKWSLPSKGVYLIYKSYYNPDKRLSSKSQYYAEELTNPYEIYYYNSKGQLKKEILMADKTLTDAITTYKYKDGQIKSKKICSGTVYGKYGGDIMFKEYYLYNEKKQLEFVIINQDDLYTKEVYTYSANGDNTKIEFFKKEKGGYILESTYYYWKFPVNMD